jgi:hypothetical protein
VQTALATVTLGATLISGAAAIRVVVTLCIVRLGVLRLV